MPYVGVLHRGAEAWSIVLFALSANAPSITDSCDPTPAGRKTLSDSDVGRRVEAAPRIGGLHYPLQPGGFICRSRHPFSKLARRTSSFSSFGGITDRAGLAGGLSYFRPLLRFPIVCKIAQNPSSLSAIIPAACSVDERPVAEMEGRRHAPQGVLGISSPRLDSCDHRVGFSVKSCRFHPNFRFAV